MQESSPSSTSGSAAGSPAVATLRFDRKEVAGWCLYDFANSAFNTVILTTIFAVYFKTGIAADEGSRADAYWGGAISVAMILVALTAPVLGAIADRSGRKKPWLFFTTVVCVLATGGLAFMQRGDVWPAILLFGLALWAFESGFTFYNAFLADICPPADAGKVSGWGYAVGYVGGLLCLVACLPLAGAGLVRWTSMLTAVFFALAAVPTFLWVRERPVPGGVARLSPLGYVRFGFGRVRDTFRGLRRFRQLGRLLVANLVYNDAISTIIVFCGNYAATTLGFSQGEIIVLLIASNVTALFGAWLFGYVFGWIGGKPTIRLSLFIWMGVVLMILFVDSRGWFWFAALVGGFVMGAPQAASRSLVSLFTPRGKQSEVFGLFSLCQKMGAVLGPAVFGQFSFWFGQRWAMLSVLCFFVAGWLLLERVDEDEGRRVGREVA